MKVHIGKFNKKGKRSPCRVYVSRDDLFNLDMTISTLVVPLLKKFRKHTKGYPSNITSEEWDKILDEMIYSFESNSSLLTGNIEEQKKIKEGLLRFAEYFHHLWY